MTSNIPKAEEEISSLNSKEEENDDGIISTTSATTSDIPSFGWSQYAERVNGRFAMVGFLAILLIETLNHSSFLKWIGL